ncbi:MAG: hypothetical protein HYX75_17650 [Acidobacteria bacterium]|nr:hypothetical protein [Acidobacteriota bacterium]
MTRSLWRRSFVTGLRPAPQDDVALMPVCVYSESQPRNIPFNAYSYPNQAPRVGVRVWA